MELIKYEYLYSWMFVHNIYIDTGVRYNKRFGVVPEGSALQGKVIVELYAGMMHDLISLQFACLHNVCVSCVRVYAIARGRGQWPEYNTRLRQSCTRLIK